MKQVIYSIPIKIFAFSELEIVLNIFSRKYFINSYGIEAINGIIKNVRDAEMQKFEMSAVVVFQFKPFMEQGKELGLSAVYLSMSVTF